MSFVTSFFSLVLQLLPIIVFFGAGIAVRRRLLHHWHNDQAQLRSFQRGLNVVLLDVLLPAVAFLSMAQLPLALGWRLAWVPTLGLAVALLALTANHFLLRLAPFRPANDDQHRALDMLAPWSNSVIVGLPTIATLLGPDVLYVPLLETSFVWTLVLGTMIVRRTPQIGLAWASLQPLLRAPWFWTLPLGLVWNVLELPLGGAGLVVLERAREAFLALGLLVVGLGFDLARLQPQHLHQLPMKAIAVSGAVKLLLCPLLALVLALPLGLPTGVPAALALTVATPSSLTAYMIGEREGIDTEFMSFVFALYGVVFFGSVLFVRAVLVPLLG